MFCAAAALFLATLSALPCRGTDTGKVFANATVASETSHRTITDEYLLLLTTDIQTHVSAARADTVAPTESPAVTVPMSRGTSTSTEEYDKKKTKRRREMASERGEAGARRRAGDAGGPGGPGGAGGAGGAPLLNYIFDTYSSQHTHQHKDGRAAPGHGIYAAAPAQVRALVGSTAYLDCKVDALHDKLVSWVRRKNDEEPMDLLTTGTQLYAADDRFSARFIPPDTWRLEVRRVRASDAAHYDCQLSAHPPRSARVTLHVPEVSVRIVDGAGAAVAEQVCEEGSTAALRCEVRGLRMEGGPPLLWYRRRDLLNDDTTRGGISVRTEFGPDGAHSMLRVARVRGADAGRYACSVGPAPAAPAAPAPAPAAGPAAPAAPAAAGPAPLEPAYVLLHVIKEVSVRIVDGAGAAVAEQVCEEGSTAALRCEVRGLRMEGGPPLLWYRRRDLLNDDTTRGGISVRTEFGPDGAHSMLRVARVRGADAGRYACSVGPAPAAPAAPAPAPAAPAAAAPVPAHAAPAPLEPAYVLLHVIKGESLAELQQDGSGARGGGGGGGGGGAGAALAAALFVVYVN